MVFRAIFLKYTTSCHSETFSGCLCLSESIFPTNYRIFPVALSDSVPTSLSLVRSAPASWKNQGDTDLIEGLCSCSPLPVSSRFHLHLPQVSAASNHISNTEHAQLLSRDWLFLIHFTESYIFTYCLNKCPVTPPPRLAILDLFHNYICTYVLISCLSFLSQV